MTAFVFKVLAMVSMTLDHCAVGFGLPVAFETVGRLALPLYAFMVVDSYLHLRGDRARLTRYIRSMAVMAVITEFIFDFVRFGQLFVWEYQNQLLQFLLVLCVFVVTEKMESRPLKAFVWVVAVVATYVLRLGYFGTDTVIMIIMKAYLERREGLTLKGRFLYSMGICVAFALCALIMYALVIPGDFIQIITDPGLISYVLLTYGVAAVALVFLFAFYNGEYGNPPRWFRVLYRYYYPGHLLVLGLIVRAIS